VATLALTIVLAFSLAVLMHWWPRLAAPRRLRLSLATSAAGVGFLVAALQAEGLRETALVSDVLVGQATRTATASASASLCYYVLTAVCLLLGFAGLVFGEPLSRWLSPRIIVNSVAVAWLLTLVRFLLEKSAAPPLLVQAVGVTWLAPVAGAYFATAQPGPRHGDRSLVRALVAYAYLVRSFVALVGVVATQLGLGTHYDVSAVTSVPVALTAHSFSFLPASARQIFWLILVPQLVVWPAFTVATGLLGAGLARFLPASASTPLRPPTRATEEPGG
jgi:MFS family permease